LNGKNVPDVAECPEFGKRLVALHGSNRYLGLELRRVIPPLPSRHALAPHSSRYAAFG
jgi:hypothetical protein